MRSPSIPPRVFGFVGTLVVVTLFSVFNLDHRSPVSFGFHVVEDVPIFIACLTSFTFGAVVMVPLVLRRRVRAASGDQESQHAEGRKTLSEHRKANELSTSNAHDDSVQPVDSAAQNDLRRVWWRPWSTRRSDRRK